MATTRKQIELMKRMAWQAVQPREVPAEDEKRLAYRAVRMLNYVASLNYAMYELEEDMRAAGRYRQNVARYCAMARRIVNNAHDAAFRMLVSVSKGVGREYNDATDATWQAIDAAVLLQSPERGYNIVCALARLIEGLNAELGMRYYFEPARAIARIPSIIEVCKVHDYHIDNIIDLNVKD